MSIIDGLLATFPLSPSLVAGREGRAVREVRIGAFWTAVALEDGRCGLASALRDDDHHHDGQNPVRGAGHLHERIARELAELARSDSLLEASIGLAAINAPLDVDEDACVELNAEQVILDQGTGKGVVVVGHFPFIPRVREAARQLWVLEKRPGEGDLPAEAAPETTHIGDGVTIGHGCMIHTATVRDYAVVGMGSVVSGWALISVWGVIGEGAVVKQNQEVPDGHLWRNSAVSP